MRLDAILGLETPRVDGPKLITFHLKLIRHNGVLEMIRTDSISVSAKRRATFEKN